MRKLLFAAPIALLVAGCDTGPAAPAANATPAAADNEPGGSAPPVEEPGDAESAAAQANGEIALDPDWTQRRSPDVPYYNETGRAVPVYARPDPTSEKIGEIAPGDGGFFNACAKDVDFCRIELGGAGAVGWIDPKGFGGRAL